jgi:hypothetical protein
MSRTVNLIDYLPNLLQEFKELKTTMLAENPEFQLINDEGNLVLNNTFIMYCNEAGIKKFEKMMKIFPSAGDSLEVRRNRVLTRWNDTVPYTLKTFLVKLITLQGNDNVQVTFDKDTYTLQVVTHLEKQGQQNNLAYLFKTIVPCNLVVDSVNILNCNSVGSLNMGAGISIAGVHFITNDIDETFDISSQMALANVITSTEVISII